MTTLASLLAVVAALTAPPTVPQRMDVPWRVGERAEYDVRFTSARVGTGRLTIGVMAPFASSRPRS